MLPFFKWGVTSGELCFKTFYVTWIIAKGEFICIIRELVETWYISILCNKVVRNVLWYNDVTLK